MLDGFVLLSIGLNLTEADWTPAALWLAVVASGLYHGANPGMGWPLAVSAGLIERSSRALVAALWPLTVGHLLAMFVVILPFALLVALVEWQQQIREDPPLPKHEKQSGKPIEQGAVFPADFKCAD